MTQRLRVEMLNQRLNDLPPTKSCKTPDAMSSAPPVFGVGGSQDAPHEPCRDRADIVGWIEALHPRAISTLSASICGFTAEESPKGDLALTGVRLAANEGSEGKQTAPAIALFGRAKTLISSRIKSSIGTPVRSEISLRFGARKSVNH